MKNKLHSQMSFDEYSDSIIAHSSDMEISVIRSCWNDGLSIPEAIKYINQIRHDKSVVEKGIKTCTECGGRVDRLKNYFECRDCFAIGDLLTGIMTRSGRLEVDEIEEYDEEEE